MSEPGHERPLRYPALDCRISIYGAEFANA